MINASWSTLKVAIGMNCLAVDNLKLGVPTTSWLPGMTVVSAPFLSMSARRRNRIVSSGSGTDKLGILVTI